MDAGSRAYQNFISLAQARIAKRERIESSQKGLPKPVIPGKKRAMDQAVRTASGSHGPNTAGSIRRGG